MGLVNIISAVLMVVSLYLLLTFIENVQQNQNKRITKQTKIATLICFTIALFLPIVTKYITSF